MSNATQARSTGQSRLQRIGDAVVGFLLRSPLHPLLSGRLLLITVIGRKTGREYTNPVGYAEYGGRIIIGTRANWRRNVRPSVPVRIVLRGKELQADAEVITDFERLTDLYSVILRRNPTHGKFAQVSLTSDGSVDHDQLRRAIERGTSVVRLSPR
ncbi:MULTISPECIES: nitroreductase/quinone reductase family protein [unclassified Nocardia]|uniref:nitroreductase/quinone reductase family protein n=1 Tax=unclassified Nocardia TaxID=2637762 RepID=UPI001CE3BAE4|nr:MULTISPECIES: nitroreductase/quinone reductase family protein [unclassified Nocardia]